MRAQKFPTPDRPDGIPDRRSGRKIARPAGPGKKKTHRRASEEKTANDDARGRAAPLIPTMALVPSGAGEVVLAQVNGGRIVGRSGTSDSWAAYRQNVAAVFAQFRDERLSESTVGVLMGTTHARITEEDATSRHLWEMFADYLYSGYKKPAGSKGAGKSLAIQTAQDYMKTALQLAHEAHKGHPFFHCLNPLVDKRLNEDRRWFLDLREQMWKRFYVRAVEQGDKLDESAPPLGIEHVKAIARSLGMFASRGQMGQTRVAHERKFAILSLWQVAGRSGEIAWLSYKKLAWDEQLRCVHVEVAQLKTVKVKRLVFVAGANRHCCWFTALGDRLATESRDSWFHDDEEYHWLFPDLSDTESPGTRIGEYIKALLPHDVSGSSKSKLYKDYVVETLPADSNAASIRAGCANMLHVAMPEAFACTTTGHKLESYAHQQYIDAETANCMPGAIVLSGFPALPWGQRGACGRPASLSALETVPLVSGVSFDKLIDDLYDLGDFCPSSLRTGGSLRPAVHAAFASQVMYYEERVRAGECDDVARKLRKLLVQRKLASADQAAHDTLCRWGVLLRDQFDRDNRRLTMREQAGLSEQMAVILNKLEAKVEALRAENRELHDQMRAMMTSQSSLIDHMGSMATAFNDLSRSMGGGFTAGSLAGTRRAPAEAPSAARLGADDETGGSDGDDGAIAITAPQVGVMTAPSAHDAAGPSNSLMLLMANQAGAAQRAAPSLAGMEAKQLFIDAWVGQGHGSRVPSNLTKQDKLNAMLVLSVYNGMLTRNEKHLMNRAENADTRTDARKKAIEVEQKVVEMCSELYEAVGKEPPKALKPPSVPKKARRRMGGGGPKPLLVSTLEGFKRVIGAGLEKDAVEAWAKERRKRKREEDTDDAGREQAALPAPESPRGADASPRSSPGSKLLGLFKRRGG